MNLTGWPCWVLALALAPGLCRPVGAAKAKPAVPSSCMVAEFKSLSLAVHDPLVREQQAQAWLQKNISRCSKEQLSAIQSNSASWLGHALTPQLSGLIDAAIEARTSGNPALMSQLYESLSKEGVESVVTYRNLPPRAPLVQPQVVQGGLVGAVNYGSMGGPSASIINQNSSPNSGQNNIQLQDGLNNTQQSLQGSRIPPR